MFKKFILFVLLAFPISTMAVEPQIFQLPKDAPVVPTNNKANKVEGLEIPPDMEVSSDEGFIALQATAKGSVKWLVISQSKVKFLTNDTANTIIISVPQNGQINVFAVALVESKLTDFAKTTITVKGTKPDPKPDIDPKPDPNPKPTSLPLHVTFVFDVNENTPDIANVLNSQEFRKLVSDNKSFLRVYDVTSDVVKNKKLDTLLPKVGTNNMMVVQSADGELLYASPIPKTDKEAIDVFKKYISK